VETPSRHSYDLDGTLRVFPVASPIKGDNYCRLEVDGTIINDRTQYDIVNNSIVFKDTTLLPDGSQLDILVVQSEEAIGQLAITTNIDIVAQDIANVNTVGDNIANVNTVAGSITDVNTVADNIADVNRVEDSIDNIDRVNTSIAKVDRVYTSIDNVDRVYTSIDNIDRVDQSITNIDRVYTSINNIDTVEASIVNVDTVATNIADVNTVATDIANVNTTAANIADVNTVANDLNEPVSEIETVASSIANVNIVGSAIANVNTTAANIADVTSVADNMAEVLLADTNAATATAQATIATTQAGIATTQAGIATTKALEVADAQSDAEALLVQFTGVYHGASATAPTVDVDTGDLYFDTTLNEMRVYDGSAWAAAGSTVNGTSKRQSYTATAGQTAFTVTGGYDAGFADVYLNGVKLVNGVDVDVSSGTGFTLTAGATVGDTVDFIGYGAFEVADTYTQAEADSLLDAKVNTSAIGTAAASDVTTSSTDTTAGRLLKVGDFGVGTWPNMTAVYPDLNNVLVNINGLYASTVLNLPTTHNYYVNTVKSIQSGALFQVAHKQGDAPTYKRYNGTGTSSGWASWQEIYHTGNEQQIGVNQTWQDKTASRASGVTYTNTIGKPMGVIINTTGQFYININGTNLNQLYGTSTLRTSHTFIIPNGHTYLVSGSYTDWFELR